MKFGVWTPLPHTIKSEPAMAAAVADALRQQPVDGGDKGFAFAVEILQEAERLGFHCSLVAERFMGPDLEAWVLASALATQTRSIELIVAVHPGIYTPQTVAKMAASLDRISGGRAAINVVNGWFEAEFQNFGNGAWLSATDARYQRMGEFMTIFAGMSDQAEFTAAGEFYAVDAVTMPSRPVQPFVPIYAASSGDAGKELIARVGHCWMLLPTTPDGHPDFAGVLETVRAGASDIRGRAARHGRDIRVGLTSHVIACATEEEAQEKVAALRAYGEEGFINRVVSWSIASGLVGSYDVVAQRLSDYREAGVDTTMFHFSPMIEGMRSFMNEVVPRMRPAVPG